MPRCIFCKEDKEGPQPEEHIFPHAMGIAGPTLQNAEVCRDCNNRLSTVDAKLCDLFGIQRTYVGVETWRGPAHYEGMNFQIERGASGPVLTIRSGGDGHAAGGTGRPGKKKRSRRPFATNVRTRMNPNGLSEVKFSVEQKLDSGISRAIHKIAFEHMALRRPWSSSRPPGAPRRSDEATRDETR